MGKLEIGLFMYRNIFYYVYFTSAKLLDSNPTPRLVVVRP